jgi:hypothetical protein
MMDNIIFIGCLLYLSLSIGAMARFNQYYGIKGWKLLAGFYAPLWVISKIPLWFDVMGRRLKYGGERG